MSLISKILQQRNARRELAKIMLTHCKAQCGSLPKNVDTPVNGRPSLFGIDSVHQMETSLSHALLVYTKSMMKTCCTNPTYWDKGMKMITTTKDMDTLLVILSQELICKKLVPCIFRLMARFFIFIVRL
jgi:hypothetical protein